MKAVPTLVVLLLLPTVLGLQNRASRATRTVAVKGSHAATVLPANCTQNVTKSVSTAKMLSITAGFYGMDRFYYGYMWTGLAKLLGGFFAVMFPLCHCCMLGRRYMPTFNVRDNYTGKGFCGKSVAPVREMDGGRVWVGDTFYACRTCNKLWCCFTVVGYITWLMIDYFAISSATLLPARRPECLMIYD